MSQIIVYENEAGAAAIMSPAPGHDPVALAETLPQGMRHFLIDQEAVPPVGAAGLDVDFDAQTVAVKPPDRGALQAEALARVDEEHAKYLVALTGGATVAERDTWKVKEEAARAFEAGTATPGQSAMLAAEAQGAGITEAVLAATIIAKADAFLALVGVAAGLRAKGRAAIIAATDDAVPPAQIEAQIGAVFTQLAQEVQAAIAQIQTATALNEGGNNHA